MKRNTAIVLGVLFAAFIAAMVPSAILAADAPADRVIAIYFHRTQRCPTCQKMGSYSEEAVKTGFVKQVKDGTVAFYYVDFQNSKNAALAKAYNISGPALIVAKISKNKVVKYADLADIWTKVADKKKFVKYVQTSVTASAAKPK
ncbi:MAG: hypothetical protein H8E44_30710 [Planctomycetes bacterium]|nr:hypothetical protein [Planctomycetota bacterium]MBL7039981.1 hypothetical protein [Pirellulaceae bacterium]